MGAATIASRLMKFRDAARKQESVLAPLEKRCLICMAGRAPSWLQPDHLTLLGLAAMLAAGACYALARWWPAALFVVNVWLFVNWVGDSLDGTLARVRNQQRPRYGFYVDHMVDTFGTLFLSAGLALSGYMSPAVAFTLLVAYYALSINVYLATYTIGTFQLSFGPFSPTEARILIAAGNVVAFAKPQVIGGRYLFYDVAGLAAAAIMTAVLVISVVSNTRTLYQQEKV